MRLRRWMDEGQERVCASDSALWFEPLAVDGGGAPHGNWVVRVLRSGPPEVRGTARTLAAATRWARPHWRPWFLEGLVRGLSEGHQAHDLRDAAVMGDPRDFLVLLDIAEEEGTLDSRWESLTLARREQLFTDSLPLQPVELEHRRAEARRRARKVAEERARGAHERSPPSSVSAFPVRVGLRGYEPIGLVVWAARLDEPEAGRIHGIVEGAKGRLRVDGIEALSEHYHSPGCQIAGVGVAVVFEAAQGLQSRVAAAFEESRFER